MGVDNRTLERLEKGLARADAETIRRAAAYYGEMPGPYLKALEHPTVTADWESRHADDGLDEVDVALTRAVEAIARYRTGRVSPVRERPARPAKRR